MTQVLPYVYKMTHKVTGEYYIGYRKKNVSLGLTAIEDLGKVYFSSSKRIEREQNFADYAYEIIAEFNTAEEAYQFEQSLIEKHITDPLNFNGWLSNKPHFDHTGQKRRPETLKKMRIARTGINKSNNEKVAKHAESMVGQTKENCERLRKAVNTQSLQRTGQTKENCERVRKMAKTKTILTSKEEQILYNLMANGQKSSYVRTYFGNRISTFRIEHIFREIRRKKGELAPITNEKGTSKYDNQRAKNKTISSSIIPFELQYDIYQQKLAGQSNIELHKQLIELGFNVQYSIISKIVTRIKNDLAQPENLRIYTKGIDHAN